MQLYDRYISLLTDFGFKRIFGTEPNKELLISFLNTLLGGERVVKDVQYVGSEKVGDVRMERKAIFDVYCEGDDGSKFIVEMQNAYQVYFKDRSVFYSTFPVREQARRGSDWDFRLTPVYTVAIVNFAMNDDAFDPKDVLHTVKLCDTVTKRVFYDKLTYVYVEIAKFDKTERELETMTDKWLFALKNLSRLAERPAALRERVFTRLFEQAEIAAFNHVELKDYEDSVNAYRDLRNSISTALDEGVEKGREQGRAEGRIEEKKEIARKMLAMQMDLPTVAKLTGLSEGELQAI